MCFSSISGGIKRYKIININDNNEYVLEDESKRKHIINLTFYDIEKPSIGDYIHFNIEFQNRKYDNNSYSSLNFGNLTECYGREITIENINNKMDEILIIERDNQRIILKRFYG